jgi:hypothetical protein
LWSSLDYSVRFFPQFEQNFSFEVISLPQFLQIWVWFGVIL